MEFSKNQLVIYKNTGKCEIGRIKNLVKGGAFVFYHEGDTASLTPFEFLFPISNDYCIKETSLGGEYYDTSRV